MMRKIFLTFCMLFTFINAMKAQSWTADNGNGTFTNPLFYDEVSDPDIIRVGEYFYLASTSMHSMPGLSVLRSKDLVNRSNKFLKKVDNGNQSYDDKKNKK